MTEKKYFPAMDVSRKGSRYEVVCGLKLVFLLKANLLADESQTVQTAPWQNPLHPLKLHDSRVAFLKTVAEWPEDTALELHITTEPNLALTPRGKTSLTMAIRSFGDRKEQAFETVLSRFLHIKGLLPVYFPEAEFTSITDAQELTARISPFSPTHALAITRRREMVSLAKPFDTKGVGFGAPLPANKISDHEAMHLFPWVPCHSRWHKLMHFLLWQLDLLWVIIRVRSAKFTEPERSRLSETIETTEAYLTKSEACRTVLSQQAERLRDISLERLVELHENALNVGVFVLARHPIDLGGASVLGQAITSGYDCEDKRGLLRGGVVIDSTPVVKTLDGEFFAEQEPFTAQEAACAFRLPAPPLNDLPGLPVKRSRTAFISLPKGYMDQDGLIRLGTNQHKGIEQPVVVSVKDRLRHCFIMGQTGTGKSTLLETMILQDIREGRGLCLLDPHGELIESILGKIPRERAGDVIVFDPMDWERPVGFNLIEWNTIEERDYCIDEIYLCLDRTYSMRETGGPIFESNMRSMMKLLMGNRKRKGFVPTILEFPMLYLRKDFRDWLKETTEDSQVHDFLKELEHTGGEASLNNLAPYITSKFSRFVNDIRLRRIFGQEHTPFDFKEIMDQGKILLVSLGKGRFGDIVSGLLAGFIVGRFKTAAMSRADQPKQERRNFFLYVDEFHNLPKENFGELLSEARKYHLGLVLATQYADQLKGSSGYERDDLLPAVLGNVGTIVMFRIGIKDAEKIAPAFYPVFNQKDLLELPNFHAYARFQVGDTFLPAFSFRTQKEESAHNRELASRLRTLSRLKYGLDAEIVDAQIRRRRDFWKNG